MSVQPSAAHAALSFAVVATTLTVASCASTPAGAPAPVPTPVLAERAPRVEPVESPTEAATPSVCTAAPRRWAGIQANASAARGPKGLGAAYMTEAREIFYVPSLGVDPTKVARGIGTALAFDGAGEPFVSYEAVGSGAARVAEQSGGSWRDVRVGVHGGPTVPILWAGSATVFWAERGSGIHMARRDASGTWDESKVPGSRAEATLTATTEGDRIVVASEGEPVEVWSALPGQPFQRESISESDGVAPFLVSDQRSAVIGLVAGAPRAGERRFALLRRDAASGFRTVASTELATDERIVGAGEGVAVWFVTGPSGSRVLWAHGGSLRSAALSLASDDGTPLRPPVSVRAFRDGACLTVVRVHVDGMVTPAAWTTVIDTLAWPPGPT